MFWYAEGPPRKPEAWQESWFYTLDRMSGKGSRATPSHSSGPCRKAAGIEGAAGQREVASGAERKDHIVQDARSAQAPQHEGSDAQKKGGGACDPQQPIGRIGSPVHAVPSAIASRGTGCSRIRQ